MYNNTNIVLETLKQSGRKLPVWILVTWHSQALSLSTQEFAIQYLNKSSL